MADHPKLRPSETSDILYRQIKGELPLTTEFQGRAVLVSKPPEDEYPPIPWYAQVVGINNDSLQARHAYWMFHQKIGCRMP